MKFEVGRRGGFAAGLCSLDTSNVRLLCQLASFGTLGSTGGNGSVAGPCPLRSRRKLALFVRGRWRVRFVITRVSQSTCPSYCPDGNWVCFARLPQGRQCSRLGRALASPAGVGPIGFVWRNKPQRRLRGRLRPPAPVSVCAGKLGSFVPAVATTISPATSFVPTHSCRWGELASFRTPSFGVPRLRGSDRSCSPQGGTPDGP